MSVKQPVLGIIGLVISMAISLVIISFFSAQMFDGWVTYFVATCVPVEVTMALVLQTQYPAFLKDMAQPMKGLALLIITLIVAAIISLAVFYTAAKTVSPPAPMTIVYLIFAVLITFWFVVPWGVWPVSAVTKSQFATGLSVLLVTYLLGYLLFYLLFDFSILGDVPPAWKALDPMGAFNFVDALSFSVTTVTIIFVLILFDFWPITAVPAFRAQPLMGLATTIFVFIVAGIVWWIGAIKLGFGAANFQTYGSIGLLFGCLVPAVMFEGQLFAGLKQPVAGLLRLAIAALCGWLLPQFYLWIQPMVTDNPPNLENWLASALLAMTFPMMVVVAQYFNFWPLRGNEKK